MGDSVGFFNFTYLYAIIIPDTIKSVQCYDKYLQKNLRKAAKNRGHSFWARGPDNAGQYNSQPHETSFFCERGDYDSYYGRFFLLWYAQSLTDHADNVLSLASLAFEETKIIVKVCNQCTNNAYRKLGLTFILFICMACHSLTPSC